MIIPILIFAFGTWVQAALWRASKGLSRRILAKFHLFYIWNKIAPPSREKLYHEGRVRWEGFRDQEYDRIKRSEEAKKQNLDAALEKLREATRHSEEDHFKSPQSVDGLVLPNGEASSGLNEQQARRRPLREWFAPPKAPRFVDLESVSSDTDSVRVVRTDQTAEYRMHGPETTNTAATQATASARSQTAAG